MLVAYIVISVILCIFGLIVFLCIKIDRNLAIIKELEKLCKT